MNLRTTLQLKKIVDKYKILQKIENFNRKDRPTILNEREERSIVAIVKNNPSPRKNLLFPK